ncbi:S8 family serine peptidase [Fulvivirga sediminis]|uniref:S8 family serine peptidase n=1 Tax=Fulvivirga sediminis TaxID=2803949 RepID=A0A937FAJ6_9BACT|nr:S8 family serine peptidase [Fulvivirga sediminis]MBL3657304.1 S8 family serine peptidase [Fulvivirga sediminis]
MAKTRFILSVMYFLLSISWVCAQNRYMVFFSDKNDSPYSINTPSQFLSDRAIERRLKFGIAIDENDIPVNPDYVKGISEMGVDVYYKSRWLNGILIETDASTVEGLIELEYVSSVRLLAPGNKLSRTARTQYEEDLNAMNTSTKEQLNMMGLNLLHEDGFTGHGMLTAVLDGGFSGINTIQAFTHLYDSNRLVYTYDLVRNHQNIDAGSTHGTRVLSVIAGYKKESYIGSAYNSDYMLFITEDSDTEYTIEEYNWLIAAERADSAGADIISSSLGYFDFDDVSMNYDYSDYDGHTTIIAQAADFAAKRGILVVVSAGNEGGSSWNYITSPADAEGVISVGSVDLGYNTSLFSSGGPTADGRLKPELMALGSSTSIISESGNITSASGTSYSTPLVAGFAACLWQQNPELSAQEVRDLMLKNATRSGNPDNLYGYGVPNYRYIISGVDNEYEESRFLVYPNPVINDEIHLATDVSTGKTLLMLYAKDGALLSKETIDFCQNRDYSMKVNLSKGIYFLQVLDGDKSYYFKVVKY